MEALRSSSGAFFQDTFTATKSLLSHQVSPICVPSITCESSSMSSQRPVPSTESAVPPFSFPMMPVACTSTRSAQWLQKLALSARFKACTACANSCRNCPSRQSRRLTWEVGRGLHYNKISALPPTIGNLRIRTLFVPFQCYASRFNTVPKGGVKRAHRVLASEH